MKTLSPTLLSDITFSLDIYFFILAVISRVPLFGHSIWSILLDSITDNPTLDLDLWFESFKVVIILMDLTYLYYFMVWFTIYFFDLILPYYKTKKSTYSPNYKNKKKLTIDQLKEVFIVPKKITKKTLKVFIEFIFSNHDIVYLKMTTTKLFNSKCNLGKSKIMFFCQP